jgi:hypothetical protein
MVVPGLAATIAVAGASHGALLGHAYPGHAEALPSPRICLPSAVLTGQW